MIKLAFLESMNHYSTSNSKYLQSRFKMSILKSDNSKKKKKKKKEKEKKRKKNSSLQSWC